MPVTKPFFDLSLSALGFLLSTPLWLLVAASIQLEDGGPIFYGQEPVGNGGSRFKSWEFRSVGSDSERRFEPRRASNGALRVTRNR